MKASEYNFSISFCDAIYYSAEDVVKIISEATVLHQLCNMPDKMDIAIHLGLLEKSESEIDSIVKVQNVDSTTEPWLAYHSTVKDIYHEEELRDQNYYFMDRMIKSVLNHEIEFWNVDATKVIDLSSTDLGLKPKVKSPEPVSVEYALKKIEEHTASILDGSFVQAFKDKPKNQSIYSPLHRTARYQRQYDDIDYWISRSTLYKSDLIKFCESQKIESNFDDLDKDIKPGIPGLIPNISIGKLAISIAWDIEQETKRFAKPKEVIAILQKFADEGKHSEFLHKKLHKGVEWFTDKSVYKPYTLGGCGTALRAWRKSRVNK
ncbi:MAG: hypothetical protein HHJ17_14220 [Rhodoferax sp.]|uniref:hypothetical protein n=1 Tax=Rhodoferax sp. TaxID=50421 RepID=UPI00179A72C7|nr:hypothetical protein [Rhodoferax sp.]NMM14673.1 hypothetical protein [Rhodoferax sp.]